MDCIAYTLIVFVVMNFTLEASDPLLEGGIVRLWLAAC